MSYTTQLEKEIREAYAFLREKNTSIPEEALDFMLNASIEKIVKMENPQVDKNTEDMNKVLMEAFHTSNEQFAKMYEEIVRLRKANEEQWNVLNSIPKPNILVLNENAQKKLEYIKGNGFIRNFPKAMPTAEWVGAVLDLLEETGNL
jgi:hypothetical protein